MGAELVFDLPDFPRRKDAGERRILAQTLPFCCFGAHYFANLIQRPPKNAPPFGVTTQQGWRGGILSRPAPEVCAGDLQQRRRRAQPGGGAAGEFQADGVLKFVAHNGSLSRVLPSASSAGQRVGVAGLVPVRAAGIGARRGGQRTARLTFPPDSDTSPNCNPQSRKKACKISNRPHNHPQILPGPLKAVRRDRRG